MSESIYVQAGAENSGQRLDAFLTCVDGIESRNAAQRLIEQEMVLLGGKPLKKKYTVTCGDIFCITLPEPEITELVPENIPLDVRYEDDDVIVINKPKNMVVHPAAGHPSGTLVNALMYHCGSSLSGIGGQMRPGIVHRIDKDTSGLIIAAKNDFAHQSLSNQLKDRSLTRIYHALVCGIMSADEGTVELTIGRSLSDRKKMAVNVPGGRSAVTHWRVLERFKDITHVQCRLETGRTHQIRVHMAAIARPILGDEVYGGRAVLKYGQTTQCLHAKELRFVHPRTGEVIKVESEFPEYFEQLLTKLRKIV